MGRAAARAGHDHLRLPLSQEADELAQRLRETNGLPAHRIGSLAEFG
jgi:hypothetical protein